MIYDELALANPAIRLQIEQLSLLYGINVTIFEYNTLNNAYTDIYPELVPKLVPKGTAIIVLAAVIRGEAILSYVSLKEMLDQELEFYCLTILPPSCQLELLFPDNKSLTLHLVMPEGVRAGSSLNFKYYARVI